MNVIRANKKLLGMLLGVALCFGMGNAISAQGEWLQPKQLIVDNSLPQAKLKTNEAVAREYASFWNTGNETLARNALAAGFIDKTPPEGRKQGPEGAILASRAFRAAVPDLRCDVEQILFQAIAWFRIYIFTARSPEHLAS